MGKKERVPKHRQRLLVRAELTRRGLAVEDVTGRGLLPGARLSVTHERKTLRVAVKCSFERALGFGRDADGDWRPLINVDWIVAIVPAAGVSDDLQIYCFDASYLIEAYDNALSEMKRARRAPSLEMPIYIPLDRRSRKNVGHSEVGLAERAMWSSLVEGAGELPPIAAQESFIEKVKREFAEINNVNVEKVSVEFRIIS
jgi:hypothetical protein